MFVTVLLKIISRANRVISHTMIGKCQTRESSRLFTSPLSVEDNLGLSQVVGISPLDVRTTFSPAPPPVTAVSVLPRQPSRKPSSQRSPPWRSGSMRKRAMCSSMGPATGTEPWSITE